MSNQEFLELEKAMKTESPSPNPLPVGEGMRSAERNQPSPSLLPRQGEGKVSQPGRADTSLKGGVKGPPLLAQFSKSVGPDGRVEFVGVAAAVSLRGTDVVIMAGDRARLLLVLQEMAGGGLVFAGKYGDVRGEVPEMISQKMISQKATKETKLLPEGHWGTAE
jgi:hypothetical protein